LDLTRQPALEFSKPDVERFPCVSLGRAALEAGGTAPAVLNAANEIAVAAFCRIDLAFSKSRQSLRPYYRKTLVNRLCLSISSGAQTVLQGLQLKN